MADCSEISNTHAFRDLLKMKRRFAWRLASVLLISYFGLPLLAASAPVVHAFGTAVPAWAAALVQFPTTWLVCAAYLRKSRRFDDMVDQICRGAGIQPARGAWPLEGS
ncbi:DUF485 domain-containing protein [Alicyclobacillus contaminans]|uniref:DUF485 domain-containing protein n=1 Tax=Alicyclobacillus contaminans TaxID=392016 RepID=UPI0004146ABD|nr:DUF485 domain-containing protein [Alicyclobacillus contaminans]